MESLSVDFYPISPRERETQREREREGDPVWMEVRGIEKRISNGVSRCAINHAARRGSGTVADAKEDAIR